MSKKNLRLIPKSIRSRLVSFKGQPIVAAGSKVYSATELEAGVLKHLGVELANGELSSKESIVPPEESGKYSYRNVNGEEIIRRDLSKETHYNAVESPNWGDSYNGTHTVYLPYEKYPRDFIGPRFTQIKISASNPQNDRAHYAIVFEVDRVLDQKNEDFQDDILECLNLLQENVGFCGVQLSGATLAEHLQTLRVSWEVLPPGTREETLLRVFGGKSPSPKEKAEVEERYDFLMSLRPEKLVYGTSGLERYFGALIQDDLIVFENVQYGNAIYVMFEDWKELSQRTRTELLSGRYGKNFQRITHGKGWKGVVKAIIKQRLDKKEKLAK
jgi:hypothetical protein